MPTARMTEAGVNRNSFDGVRRRSLHPAYRTQVADGDQGAATAAEEVLRVDLDWRSAALACAGVVGLVAVFAVASATSRTLTWVVIGPLLALALDPLVDRIQQRLGLRRGVAVGVRPRQLLPGPDRRRPCSSARRRPARPAP